jgi:hypothetical protein
VLEALDIEAAARDVNRAKIDLTPGPFPHGKGSQNGAVAFS